METTIAPSAREAMQQAIAALEIASDYIDNAVSEYKRLYEGRPLLEHRWRNEQDTLKRHCQAIAALRAAESAHIALLQQARDALFFMVFHFTMTPSSLRDSQARGQGHKAIAALDAVIKGGSPHV